MTVILLAAGQGTRMKSPLPKVLHPISGEPMIYRIIRTIQSLGDAEIRVVVGHGKELVSRVVDGLGVTCLIQEKQLGTGDAVRVAMEPPTDGDVLVLNGDHPLITADDLSKIVREFKSSDVGMGVVTCELGEPGSFGRIVRDSYGTVQAIVEAKDATDVALKIKEVNTGIYVASSDIFKKYLPQIQSTNAQNEYYLTDVVELMRTDQKEILGIKANRNVAFGVNSQMELAMANKEIYRKKVDTLLENGVIVLDPETTYVEDEVEVGSGAVLYPGVFLRGKTQIGALTVIEPNCMIIQSTIGDSCEIKAGSYIEKSEVGERSVLGPYARLRPETKIGKECKIGNFVELKKVDFGDKSKASHLTYLGDAEVGEDTNIGCGTITCNYREDKKKYKTKIGSGVFVGSDTQFIAPVEIGDGALIGSGSTITKNVPKDALAVARGRQIVKEGWATRFTGKK